MSIIDNDTDMIRAAATFGFKVYYGDGTRLDILRAAGAATADFVVIATDKKDQTNRIVELMRAEYPLVKVMARSFDRGHSIELVQAGVEFQIREVFESALLMGRETLLRLGTDELEADEIIAGVRERDQERFEAQVLGGLSAGRDLLLSNAEDQAEEVGVTPRSDLPEMPEEEKAPAS